MNSDERFEGDDRSAVYREGDCWIMRASGFGGCVTRLARTAAGVPGEPTPDWLQFAFDFGAEHEPEVISRLEAGGEWRVLRGEELAEWGSVDDTGQLALEMRLGKGVVRCHPDGIVEREDGKLFVLEVKTAAKSNDPNRGHYDWQFSIEHAVTGLPVLLVIGWKETLDDGTVKLVDGPPEVRVLDEPPHTAGEIKRRIAQLVKVFNQATEQGGWEEPCDKHDYPCPYVALCGEDNKAARAQKKEDEAQRIEDQDLVERIARHAATVERKTVDKKIAEAVLKEAKSALKEIVGTGKFIAGEWYIDVKVDEIPESVSTRKAHTRTTVTAKRREAQELINDKEG